MNPETIAFLETYLDCLRTVNTRNLAYANLTVWQAKSYPYLANVLPNLNNCLGLQSDGALQNHIATSSVGDLSGLVVVAANPGWHPQNNLAENNWRIQNLQNNQEFTREFFHCYPCVTGSRSRWWTKVLRQYSRVSQDAAAQQMNAAHLWEYAHAQNWPVGGIDLVPFHSTADRITPMLLNPVGIPARQMLRNVALETLRMALRIKPQLLLVASAVGAQLVQSLAADMPEDLVHVQTLHCQTTRLWFNLELYQSPLHHTRILVIPGQVFSGRYRIPNGFSLEPLAVVIRDVMAGDYDQQLQDPEHP